MTDDYVSRELCEERKCIMDERFKRDKDAIETLQENMNTLTKLVTELATIQRTNSDVQAEHEKRIRNLEQVPAGKWDRLVGYIMAALASGFIGYFVSTIIGQ